MAAPHAGIAPHAAIAPGARIAPAPSAAARSGRRRLIVAAIAALGLTALTAPAAFAFTPEAGTYVDHSSSLGHRISFHYAGHTGTVQDFKLHSNTIFSHATVHHTSSGWRFSHHEPHYIVHGHWLNHWAVHGSICNLHIDPTGCRTSGNGKQSFEAVFPNAKPPEGPWTGTASNLQGATGPASFRIGPSNSGGDRIAVKDLVMPNYNFGDYGPLVKNEFTGVWHYGRHNEAVDVRVTWDDPTHMHGHANLKGHINRHWTFTAHYVGNAK